MRRDQALEVVVGQAPVDAVIERCGRGIKISPDQGAPYAVSEQMVVLFAADGHPCSATFSVSVVASLLVSVCAA